MNTRLFSKKQIIWSLRHAIQAQITNNQFFCYKMLKQIIKNDNTHERLFNKYKEKKLKKSEKKDIIFWACFALRGLPPSS